MNIVATSAGHFVEVQGAAEGETFSREQLDEMLDTAMAGCDRIFEEQRRALEIEGTA